VLVEPLLIVRRVIRKQLGILHRRLLAIATEAIVQFQTLRRAKDAAR
jgi:hypothetical protein